MVVAQYTCTYRQYTEQHNENRIPGTVLLAFVAYYKVTFTYTLHGEFYIQNESFRLRYKYYVHTKSGGGVSGERREY